MNWSVLLIICGFLAGACLLFEFSPFKTREQRICDELNKTLPKMIDSHCRLDHTVPAFHEIDYLYTIINLNDNDVITMQQGMHEAVIDDLFAKPKTKKLLESGERLSYCYRNKKGQVLLSFVVTKDSLPGSIDSNLTAVSDNVSKGMIVAAEIINKKGPHMVDEITRLDSALPRYRGITYFFTLMSKDTELVVKNKELLQRQVTSAVLVNPESKENIALGLVMTYCYRDLAGKTLIEFDVDKNSKIDQSLKDAPDILSQGLIVAAENINKTTPRMLDESTRLDSAKAKPDGLNYNYTLIGMSDADAIALKANTEEQTSKNLHAKPDTEKLLEKGATLTFNYSNAAGKRLFTFDVKK
jgi:hypothetical protein